VGQLELGAGSAQSDVPALTVHVMPGSETDRRELSAEYQRLYGSDDPNVEVPRFSDFVKARAPEGVIVETVQVSPDGGWQLGPVATGSYLVFADYTSDIGDFAWCMLARVHRDKTATVDLAFPDRIPLERLAHIDLYEEMPPPPAEIEEMEKDIEPTMIEVTVPRGTTLTKPDEIQ